MAARHDITRMAGTRYQEEMRAACRARMGPPRGGGALCVRLRSRSELGPVELLRANSAWATLDGCSGCFSNARGRFECGRLRQFRQLRSLRAPREER